MTCKKKTQDVLFLVEGTKNLVKGVTKHTTCSDVISTIFGATATQSSFAIFESSRGIDRILPGKTKILKVMRTWGSEAGNMQLVIRRTNALAPAPRVSLAKRRLLRLKGKPVAVEKENQPINNLDADDVSKKLQTVEQLTEMVDSQRRKLVHLTENNLNYSKSNGYTKEVCVGESDDSMVDFMCHVDSDRMTGFLNFCGTVSAAEKQRLSGLHAKPWTATASPNIMVSSQDALVKKTNNDVKFAVKKSLKPASSSTSSRTSVSDNCIDSTPMRRKFARGLKHTFIDGDKQAAPVCSTPVAQEPRNHGTKRSENAVPDSIDAKIARMNQHEGKRALMKRYFNDYEAYQSPRKQRSHKQAPRQRGDGVENNSDSLRSFRLGDGAEDVQSPSQLRSLAEKCKLYWTQSEESEEETELQGLDNAFIGESEDRDGCRDNTKATASRQSSGSSLVSRQLVNYDATKIVDYSLSDDESNAFANNSECSYSTEGSDVHVNGLEKVRRVAMATSANVGYDSDEGLSSLGSDDFVEDRGIFV